MWSLALIFHVPVWLGIIHQAMAMILFGVTVGFIHYVKPQKRWLYGTVQ